MDTTQAIKIPAILENYQVRPVEQQDSQAIYRMMQEIEAVDQRHWFDTLEDRERDLHDPDSDPATDSLIVLTPGGQAAALGWIFTPREADQEYVSFLWGEVHPQHRRRGLGEFILSWMEARASQISITLPDDRPHSMRANIKHGLQDRIELHEQHGFQFARSFYRMRRDLKLPISRPDLPASFILNSWEPARNQQALEAVNEAFSDHWGFIPVSEENWKHWIIEHEDFRPDLSFMVLSAETQEIVALSINKVNRADNQSLGIQEGWITDLCVLRPWRKQGIATALLNASMQAFKDNGLEYAGLGVDTENPTGALRIYERLGFEPVMRSHTYSKLIERG